MHSETSNAIDRFSYRYVPSALSSNSIDDVASRHSKYSSSTFFRQSSFAISRCLAIALPTTDSASGSPPQNLSILSV
ncbi:unnamed protein product [Chondrus crispus]|uniref:Uncharacterized protein n=1 Tax=Chondrus crispus TaxID=2769 RepID=R7QFG3_CHOCR|nr:unnamed protein product [Chondrus crispus]CDF36191.1 unnamed protein product [Chondrus crispus]|eukprot:XP_005716010.1 unnamed protein product [Chondrus crispus]